MDEKFKVFLIGSLCLIQTLMLPMAQLGTINWMDQFYKIGQGTQQIFSSPVGKVTLKLTSSALKLTSLYFVWKWLANAELQAMVIRAFPALHILGPKIAFMNILRKISGVTAQYIPDDPLFDLKFIAEKLGVSIPKDTALLTAQQQDTALLAAQQLLADRLTKIYKSRDKSQINYFKNQLISLLPSKRGKLAVARGQEMGIRGVEEEGLVPLSGATVPIFFSFSPAIFYYIAELVVLLKYALIERWF